MQTNNLGNTDVQSPLPFFESDVIAESSEYEASSQSQTNSDAPRPIVKWVGGKRKLLEEILPKLPETFNEYYEPFVGGGAVYFSVYDKIKQARLSDTNLELIIAYRVIQEHPDLLIAKLREHEQNHSKDYYYETRDKHFLKDPIDVAARFLYLNKTCYNGLYRVNKSGKFNTPIGKYKNPNIVQENNIHAVHRALKNAEVTYQEFDTVNPQAGDFVYFDPPYHPTDNVSFTQYTSSNFTEHDQIRLRDFVLKLHRNGVFIMLSNSKTRFIEDAYDRDGFFQTVVRAPRYVNCKPNQRGNVDELLITNYETRH